MEYFVAQQSIVRKIWGKSDTVLFIFAGAAAEFALNKAVDWLFFTGKLPADPIGRLFSTVAYARKIIFLPVDKANSAIDKITAIHSGVEENRRSKIPEWAYRDVLYMLIHYSIASFELLERSLTIEEKDDTYDVFYRLGKRMQLRELPTNFNEWKIDRQIHLDNDLAYSKYSAALFYEYEKHLGKTRYQILRGAQTMVVPPLVKKMAKLNHLKLLKPVLKIYKWSEKINLQNFIKQIILPSKYQKEIREIDSQPDYLAA
jgi:hypothetical protein